MSYDTPPAYRAIEALALLDARKAQIAWLRLMGRLTIQQIAAALDLDAKTVERDWRFSRAWLAKYLRGEQDSEL